MVLSINSAPITVVAPVLFQEDTANVINVYYLTLRGQDKHNGVNSFPRCGLGAKRPERAKESC